MYKYYMKHKITTNLNFLIKCMSNKLCQQVSQSASAVMISGQWGLSRTCTNGDWTTFVPMRCLTVSLAIKFKLKFNVKKIIMNDIHTICLDISAWFRPFPANRWIERTFPLSPFYIAWWKGCQILKGYESID